MSAIGNACAFSAPINWNYSEGVVVTGTLFVTCGASGKVVDHIDTGLITKNGTIIATYQGYQQGGELAWNLCGVTCGNATEVNTIMAALPTQLETELATRTTLNMPE